MLITVVRDTLPEAWEEAVIRCWKEGDQNKTEYDKPEDPPSRDCTLVMVVNKPFSEPRIHRAFPAGLDELEIYRQEVVNGIHDHWIREGGWNYTYHNRLWKYPNESDGLGQMDHVVEKLTESPHTRRAQAIVWCPEHDMRDTHAPCLQRLWFRVLNGKLEMHVHIRSNDAYKAGFMNMWAFTDIQRWVAERVGVPVGAYTHIADSWHIYGSYFYEFEGFLLTVEHRSFEERTWRSDSELIQGFFEEGRKRIVSEEIDDKNA